MAEAYIIDAVRTPRGIGKQGKGALAEQHPQHLAATVRKASRERNDLATATVDVTLTDNLVPGLVNYNSAVDGNVGMFSVVVSTGLGDPFVGGPGEAEIDLSVQAGGPVEGTLVVTLTDEDMTIPAVDSGATWIARRLATMPSSPSGTSPPSMRGPDSVPARNAPAAIPTITGASRSEVCSSSARGRGCRTR